MNLLLKLLLCEFFFFIFQAQYTFLYELALEYFEQTHTYENFGAGGQMSSILWQPP